MAAFMYRFAQFLGADDGVVSDADYAADAGDSDLLDGRDVAQVRPSAVWWSNDNLAETQGNISEDLVVTVPPGGGILLMEGSFLFSNGGAGMASAGCTFMLGSNDLKDSVRIGWAPAGDGGSCSTNAARSVQAGTHTVTFLSFGLDAAGLQGSRATFQVLVVPNP
jgi:hypothetical protein